MKLFLISSCSKKIYNVYVLNETRFKALLVKYTLCFKRSIFVLQWITAKAILATRKGCLENEPGLIFTVHI